MDRPLEVHDYNVVNSFVNLLMQESKKYYPVTV